MVSYGNGNNESMSWPLLVDIDRENEFFASSEAAGRRTAASMSLIATAKANGLESHA